MSNPEQRNSKFYAVRGIWVFHPVLFALFPVLALYARNRGQLLLTNAGFLYSLIGVLALTGLLWAGINRFLRNKVKSAILTSFYLFLIFSYGSAHSFLSGIRIDLGPVAVGPDKILFPAWAGLMVLAGIYVFRTGRRLIRVSEALTLAGIILVGTPLVFIVPFEISRAESYLPKPAPAVEPTDYSGPAPDIYYIILDRYAADSTLREEFGYDNREFLDYLRQKGFYVADQSFANYPKTHMSLASSLNLTYLDGLAEKYGEETEDLSPVFEMMQDYEVWRFLKARGYRFYHFGSAWDPTRENPFADANVNWCSFPGFLGILYRTSMFYPVGSQFAAGRCLYPWASQHERENYKIETLKEVARESGPKFVFAHLLLPHDPYFFRRDCSRPEPGEVETFINPRDYLNQLVCTNQKATELVEALLADPDNPSVIIIQADEGPFTHPEWGSRPGSDDWTAVSAAALRSHMRILNAYFLPDGDYTDFYRSISPVNSFRLIFNKVFGADYPLLPDRSYVFLNDWNIFKFFEVTEAVGYR